MGAAGAAFVGANTVRFSSLGHLSPAYFEMLDNDVFEAIADAVLLPHCGSYWVNTGQIMFIDDKSQMVVPMELVIRQKEAFVDWTVSLLDQGVSSLEVGGLQEIFFKLLSSTTGRSVEDLAAGSRRVGDAQPPAPK